MQLFLPVCQKWLLISTVQSIAKAGIVNSVSDIASHNISNIPMLTADYPDMMKHTPIF